MRDIEKAFPSDLTPPAATHQRVGLIAKSHFKLTVTDCTAQFSAMILCGICTAKSFGGSNWNDKYAFETTLHIAGLIPHDIIINSVPGICRRMPPFRKTS